MVFSFTSGLFDKVYFVMVSISAWSHMNAFLVTNIVGVPNDRGRDYN